MFRNLVSYFIRMKKINMRLQVLRIMKYLNSMAGVFIYPVITLAQLSRAVEQR